MQARTQSIVVSTKKASSFFHLAFWLCRVKHCCRFLCLLPSRPHHTRDRLQPAWDQTQDPFTLASFSDTSTDGIYERLSDFEQQLCIMRQIRLKLARFALSPYTIGCGQSLSHFLMMVTSQSSCFAQISGIKSCRSILKTLNLTYFQPHYRRIIQYLLKGKRQLLPVRFCFN